jgi:alkylation response protein AidB-like acyl-CoA dehydrogenase
LSENATDPLTSVPPFPGEVFDRLLDRLADSAAKTDLHGTWPGEQFEWLAEAGVLGWSIPQQYGGSGLSSEEMVYGYERMAAACLTTTFILTQRNGACQRIAQSEQEDVKQELLPLLADGRLFATVGISHLTTSRQHLRQPAVRAALRGQVFELNGQIPWVTGAAEADFIVTGGTCEDGRQVLLALPRRTAGVTVQEPAPLLALNGSRTASITVDGAVIEEQYLLAGPVEAVMQRGQGGGTGSVVTSSLAVGLVSRTLALMEEEAGRRADLREVVERFTDERDSLRTDLYAAARGEATPRTPHLSNESIRGRANSLALRTTQALMAASKGAGFVSGHPAERSVREAMFFLVWSCPQPLMQAALREFACLVD